MVLREPDKSSNTQQDYAGDFSEKEVELVEIGFGQVENKYGKRVSTIREITIDRYNADVVVRFLFFLKNGKQESILIHHNQPADLRNNGGGTIIVDCDGACGYTEQFNILTRETSCSCQPCVMEISEPEE